MSVVSFPLSISKVSLMINWREQRFTDGHLLHERLCIYFTWIVPHFAWRSWHSLTLSYLHKLTLLVSDPNSDIFDSKPMHFLLDWPSVMATTKGYLELIFTYNKRETAFSVSGAVTTLAAFCLKASSPPSCQSLPFNPCLRLQSRELQANIYSWNEPFSPISNPSKTVLVSSQTFEKQFASGLKKSRKK